MGLRYENLDELTRAFMLEEISIDEKANKIYLSSYLGQRRQGYWIDELKAAASSGSDDTLAAALRKPGMLQNQTLKRKPRGTGFMVAAVPRTAPETMAEGEFNRFYIRGLCRRAINEGINRLEVYRAKNVMVPRPESAGKIGLLMDPAVVLIDARANPEVETALGMPQGPNSGLTLRIPVQTAPK